MGMIILNPKNEQVEFMHNHIVYVFRAGEKKLLDDAPAKHALKESKAGLVVYDGSMDEGVVGEIDYASMPWKEVVSMASKRGVFKPGMKKDDVYRALKDADE